MWTQHHLVVFLFLMCNCLASRRKLMFKGLPTGSSLDGLGCAIEKHDRGRGVKFDTQTKTCTVLDDQWFTNQTLQPSHNYFVLTGSESSLTFQSGTFTADVAVPSTIVAGCSIKMTLETQTIGVNGGLAIPFKDADETMTAAYFNVRENEDTLLFNSLVSNVWGAEERKQNPFRTSNQLYELEFRITALEIELYIDDALFNSYYHRTLISNYQVIKFSSSYISVREIQFVYPEQD